MNPKFITLTLTDGQRSFHNSCVIETGLLNFHKMTANVLKTYFQKAKRNILSCRDFKNFCNDRFRSSLCAQSDHGDKSSVTFLASLHSSRIVKQKSIKQLQKAKLR